MNSIRIAVAAILALSSVAASAEPAKAPDPDALLMSTLLGLDTSALFPEGTFSPEVEHKALNDLYAEYRDSARADNASDETAILRFAFMGWLADIGSDPEMSRTFQTDWRAFVEKQTGEAFGAIAQAPFLIPVLCRTLSRSLAGESDPSGARSAFYGAIEPTGRELLGPLDWGRCTVAFLEPGL
jgi:hypothetical protein